MATNEPNDLASAKMRIKELEDRLKESENENQFLRFQLNESQNIISKNTTNFNMLKSKYEELLQKLVEMCQSKSAEREIKAINKNEDDELLRQKYQRSKEQLQMIAKRCDQIQLYNWSNDYDNISD